MGVKMSEKYSTPNAELAELRKCRESECLWVWDTKEFANQKMPQHRAIWWALDKSRDI